MEYHTFQGENNMSENKILRLPELRKMIGLSVTTIWRKEKAGKFPKRIHISERAVGWLTSEIEEWIEQQAGRKIHNKN